MSKATTEKLSPVEGIKQRSNYLRGTIVEGLADGATGALSDDDIQLTKYHGFYQQDDRDLRAERQRRKLEPLYSFMIRIRMAGGVATAKQWLQLDDIAGQYSNNTLRLTTRQTFQYHAVIKRDLKPTMQSINAALLDTIAACGDVNRNVMCTSLPELSPFHATAYAKAKEISEHLLPKTRAYHEIWLDGKRVEGGEDYEPVYGTTYLPRKFKIGVVIPPSNDIDIFSQDLGFIAIENDGELIGFNVTVGVGLGMTHGEPETYPRVADVIGFCTPEQAVTVAEHVVALQRDFGDRTNRKHARLKYTIDDRGLDWFTEELSRRLGFELAPAADFRFTSRGDRFGWQQDPHGLWHLCLFIPEGRVLDNEHASVRSGLRAVAATDRVEFRLTANQNLIISNIRSDDKALIETLLAEHGIDKLQHITPLRQQALACVALPTCGLAMAEAERYLNDFVSQTDALLEKNGLANEPISLRITGCPNGCARPYLAEIALVGRAPGHYSLFLGGDPFGYRLNRLVHENADEKTLLATLDHWFDRFARERQNAEPFGDFVHRLLPAGGAA
ncbi:MAG: assimilatory sulfite reductase (NADPH) hemoprotein subunit [Woeseia sp.]